MMYDYEKVHLDGLSSAEVALHIYRRQKDFDKRSLAVLTLENEARDIRRRLKTVEEQIEGERYYLNQEFKSLQEVEKYLEERGI